MNPAAMNRDEFAELVDKEVRGNVSSDLAEALRLPELAERWYQQLVQMKKSVESTLAAKGSEDKAQRLALLAAAMEAKAPDVAADLRRRALLSREQFLKWRTGALRFRAGVEDRLSEAAWRRRSTGSYVPTALLDERNQLLRRVADLTEAIRLHREAMSDYDVEDIGSEDEELWVSLNGSR